MNSASPSSNSKQNTSWWKKVSGLLFQSIRPFSGARAIRDAIAGVELAAINVPQVLGYTKIAGMPVVTGLYTLLLPPLAFAIFGSSRFLVVGADSATAALLAGGLSHMAPLASAKYISLAATVALLTAGFLLISRAFKLGFLADFLSRTVLLGFLAGVGFQVSIAVLGEMLGIEIQASQTVEQLGQLFHALAQIHWPTLALSISVITMIFTLSRFAPRVPAPLLSVACAIAASQLFHFSSQGIAIIGPVAGGFPRLAIPDVSFSDIERLVSLAASCFVIIVGQSAATARTYAVRHHQDLDENSDLVGLSAANVVAGLSGTFVVNGSPTQTSMVESSGGRSQIAQMTTAIVVAFILLVATKPLQYLPRCVLGAVVFTIAVRLIHLRDLAQIRRESPAEFTLAIVTAFAVLLVGVEKGIILAMVLSLLRIVDHNYRPHTGLLTLDENKVWKSIPLDSKTFTQPGLVIYRFGAALFYANAEGFSKELRQIAARRTSSLRWIIVDSEAITQLDYTAAQVVIDLNKDLARQKIQLAFARVHSYLKTDMDRHHVTEAIGNQFIFPRLHEALTAFDDQKG